MGSRWQAGDFSGRRVEARHSIIVAGDGLAIDDAGRERNLAKDSTIKREAVMSGRCPAGCRAHAIAVLASDYSEAVVLDLMQPLAAGRQLVGFGWEARRMNPGGRARIRNIMPIVRDYSRASQSF